MVVTSALNVGREPIIVRGHGTGSVILFFFNLFLLGLVILNKNQTAKSKNACVQEARCECGHADLSCGGGEQGGTGGFPAGLPVAQAWAWPGQQVGGGILVWGLASPEAPLM